MKLAEIKKALRSGEFACPGGYPLFFITSDGAALSFDGVRKNWRNICEAHIVPGYRRSGWHIDAIDINYEDTELYCDATNKKIPSAYGDDD